MISLTIRRSNFLNNTVKKVLTAILLIIGGLAANILVNIAVVAAWGFNDSGVFLSVIAGIAAISAVCALASVICNKTSVKRRVLLLCSQTPIIALTVILFIDSAKRYYDVTRNDYTDMWSGLRYWGAQLSFAIGTAAIITVLVTTIALALTLRITYRKEKLL